VLPSDRRARCVAPINFQVDHQALPGPHDQRHWVGVHPGMRCDCDRGRPSKGERQRCTRRGCPKAGTGRKGNRRGPDVKTRRCCGRCGVAEFGRNPPSTRRKSSDVATVHRLRGAALEGKGRTPRQPPPRSRNDGRQAPRGQYHRGQRDHRPKQRSGHPSGIDPHLSRTEACRMTHQLVLTYIVHLVRAALHCVNCQDRKEVTTQLHADQRLPSVRFGPTTWV